MIRMSVLPSAALALALAANSAAAAPVTLDFDSLPPIDNSTGPETEDGFTLTGSSARIFPDLFSIFSDSSVKHVSPDASTWFPFTWTLTIQETDMSQFFFRGLDGFGGGGDPNGIITVRGFDSSGEVGVESLAVGPVVSMPSAVNLAGVPVSRLEISVTVDTDTSLFVDNPVRRQCAAQLPGAAEVFYNCDPGTFGDYDLIFLIN